MSLNAGLLINRQHYTKLFKSRLAYIDQIMINGIDAPSMKYQDVYQIRTTLRPYEEIITGAGLGLFNQLDEGDSIVYDRSLQGWDKRYEMLEYAKGTQITKVAMDDDMDGAIGDTVPMLGFSARASIETEAASEFILGFATNTTADGTVTFSATHPQIGGGTYSNLVSGDLAQSTLEEGLNAFDNLTNDRGLYEDWEAKTLLIHPNLRWLAHELLKSQLRSDTANNAANALSQEGLNVVKWRYITDGSNNTDWFLLSDPSRHSMLWYWREEPVVDHTLDFDTGNMKTKMTMRFDHGAVEGRGIVGGNGS